MARVGKETEKVRVYGKPIKIKLFTTVNDTIHCYDYVKEISDIGAKDAIARTCHIYVIDFIREHKVNIKKDNLPKNIANLLVFL